MKEVVIIKTINGTPTDEQPDFLSRGGMLASWGIIRG